MAPFDGTGPANADTGPFVAGTVPRLLAGANRAAKPRSHWSAWAALGSAAVADACLEAGLGAAADANSRVDAIGAIGWRLIVATSFAGARWAVRVSGPSWPRSNGRSAGTGTAPRSGSGECGANNRVEAPLASAGPGAGTPVRSVAASLVPSDPSSDARPT